MSIFAASLSRLTQQKLKRSKKNENVKSFSYLRDEAKVAAMGSRMECEE